MKIKVECIKNGNEVIEEFIKECNEKHIDVLAQSCKILATNKQGVEVELAADKFRILYSNE